MTTQDIEYWARQARAYIPERVSDELDVVAEHGNHRVLVNTPDEWGREQMAEVIRRLEHGGFHVPSTTTDDHVVIEPTSDRLPAPYADEGDA